MNLQRRARELAQGTTERKQTTLMNEGVIAQSGEKVQKSQELMQQIVGEHVLTLSDAAKEITRAIYTFSAITDRVEAEKREIYKLAEEVRNQKLEAGKLLFVLDREIRSFPRMASQSIESSIGITSQNLNDGINSLVMKIRQAVLQQFKQQTDMINQAAAKTANSADALVNAKKFIGWQSLCINLFTVMVAALLLIVFITPRIPEYRANEEEQRHILNGKNFERVWPILSKQAQEEIRVAYSRK